MTVISVVLRALGTILKKHGKETVMEEWRSKEELKPSTQLYYLNQLQYLGESWRSDKICCHSDISENHQLQENPYRYKI